MAAAEDIGARRGPLSPSREVEFALDRFESGHGRLVVEGRWYGVVGRRFVRPVLHVEGRRRLVAVLDHKPWAALDGAPWRAEFAFEGDAGPSRLQVSPDIVVALPAAGPDAGDGERRAARLVVPVPRREPAAPEPVHAPAAPAEPAQRAPAVPAEPVDAERLRVERDGALADLAVARRERDAALAEAQTVQDERNRLESEAPRLRDERDAAVSDRDQFRAERDALAAEADRLRDERDRAVAESARRDDEIERMRTAIAHLQSDVERHQTTADRAIAERNAANDELERLRRTGRQPHVAPRLAPMPATQTRPNWPVRVLALVLTLLCLLLLIGLIGAAL